MLADHLPRLIVPRDHGTLLAHPSLEQAALLVEANRRLFERQPDCDLMGRPFAALQSEARAEALAAAIAYHRDAGEPVREIAQSARLLVAGHQPELFHPGVWVKNFALQHLAPQLGCVPLNLVVDNDVPKPPAIKVPLDGRLESAAYDRRQGESPYEEHRVQDEEAFRTFAERASASGAWGAMLAPFWADVVRAARRTPVLGERFAAARRSWERRWGYRPLEAPLSRVCETASFARFACHLFVHRERFRAIHNEEIRAYRERYDLRSRHHPAPELGVDGAWIETPFWGWRADEPRRQKLFVRGDDRRLELRIGGRIGPVLEGTADALVSAFRDLPRNGWKIRTRAFTTTLFSRAFLADLFVHGIGGGKYDEVVDGLMRRFLGLAAAPAFLVLSATLLLPLPRFPRAREEERAQRRLIRDIAWNPQRHLDPDGETLASLVRSKREWVDRSGATHAERVDRFKALRAATAALAPYAERQRREAIAAEAAMQERLRIHEIHASREYAFCLYPEAMLRDFFASHFPPA